MECRGLNSPAKQEDIRQVINSIKPDLICMQETKVENMDVACIRNSLGHEYEVDFVTLPAEGSRGGILIAANASVRHLTNPLTTNYTILVTVHDIRGNTNWMLTSIYGPQGAWRKNVYRVIKAT
jgi:exonuclease III